MVFNGQDHGIWRGYKSGFVDCFHHGFEWNLCRERVAVINHWISIISVPAVQLDASASGEEDLMEFGNPVNNMQSVIVPFAIRGLRYAPLHLPGCTVPQNSPP